MNQYNKGNRKRAKVITFLTKKELNKLLQDKTSCIELVKCDHHLSLHPAHLTDLNESIKEILNQSLCKYDKRFNGIILGYKNVKILDRDAAINFDSCFIHIDIELEFFIFKPKLDLLVSGVVNKKSDGHVGCLIHKMFNVSIPRPKDQINWMGSSVKLHQEVQIRITTMRLDARLPYIAGEFVQSNSEDSGISTSEEIGLVSSERSTKTILNDIDMDVEEEMDLNESTELNSSKKKKKKHKKNKSFNEDEVEADQVHKIKSPQKKKQLSLEELETTVTDLLNQSIDSTNRINKKSKKDKSNLSIDPELLSNQIDFNEIKVDTKTKRKKHKRSKSECFDTEDKLAKESTKSKSFTFASNEVDMEELNKILSSEINAKADLVTAKQNKRKRSKSVNLETTGDIIANADIIDAAKKSIDFGDLSLPSTSAGNGSEATTKTVAKRKRTKTTNVDAVTSELNLVFNKSDDAIFKTPKKKHKTEKNKTANETSYGENSQESNVDCSLPLNISELFGEQKLCSTMLMADDQDKHKRKRKSSTSNISWEDRPSIELPYDSDLENILGISLNAKPKLVETSNTTGEQNDAGVETKKKSKKKDKNVKDDTVNEGVLEENATKKKKSKKDKSTNKITVDGGFLDFIKKVNFEEILKNNKELAPPPGIDLKNIFNLATDSDKFSMKKHKSKAKHKDATLGSDKNESLPPDLTLQELFSLIKPKNKSKKHKDST